MPRRAQRTRAARAGLSRVLDERRARRNSAKQAISQLEIGAGLALDRRSRLTVSPDGDPASSSATFADLALLRDDTAAAPSKARVSQVTSTTSPVTTLAALQTEVEVSLQEIRENFSTLTNRLNELVKRMQ